MTTKKQSTKKKVRRTRKPKEYRCPIVTFLGHVDHGKTTILDQIRKSSVQSGEFGGITQKISVYSVEHNGKDITFVDTPGHEAFDLMREQGGQISDIVLLIVAANDGVKPQTKESIKIIKTTKKPCIVVLNKIDLKTSDVSKVKRDLASEGIQVESAGGDIPCVEVSGKTGKGIDDLIEMILLVAEVSEVCKNKAPKEALGKATVLESIKDASKGNVSSIIVTAGEFRKTDFVCYKKEEVSVERIKGFAGENSKTLTKVVQGYGGQLIGTRDLITPGSVIYCVPSPSIDVCEELFKSKAVKKKSPKKKSSTKPGSVKSGKKDEEPESEDNLLSEMIGDIGEDSEKSEILDVVLRSSSQGAMEAVKKSIGKIDKKEELIRVVDTKVGDISLSDVEYARSVGAIVIGFGVAVDQTVSKFAIKNRVIIRVYDLIYDLVDELKDAALALQSPENIEEEVGVGKVKKLFVLSNETNVLGVRVESGEIKKGMRCKVTREDEEICDSKITSMKCEKEDINAAATDVECGLVLDTADEVKEGDRVRCYKLVKA